MAAATAPPGSERSWFFRRTTFALCLLAFSISFSVSGCSAPDQGAVGRDDGTANQQTAFRVRSDFTAGLNADLGWAGALNENVTVNVEQPFRIRFELESSAGASEQQQFRLQYRRNGGEWSDVTAHDFPFPQREFEPDFATVDAGAAPEGWRVAQGNAAGLTVASDGQQKALRIRADSEALISLYTPQWDVTEFAASVHLPADTRQGAGLVFGFIDAGNYSRVYLNAAAGVIRVSRFVDGRETAVTETKAGIVSGQWLDIEVGMEDGEVEVIFESDTVEFTTPLGTRIPASPIGLYVAANSTAEFREIVIEGEPRAPRVSIIACAAYEHGTPTTNLLAGSGAAFTTGAGVSLAEHTLPWSGADAHGEFEWPLVIRRYADGAVTNDEGDTFEFRMADAAGQPIGADPYPVLTVSVPPRLLAGTYVETPGRLGPWEASNGDLYFIMEPAETYNVLMVVKSTDGGETWQEVDGANRPATDDLEGFATMLSGDTIHMLHQTSNDVWYHSFRTSNHPTNPDTWDVRDEHVAAPGEPPTQVATIAIRPDGSIVGVYGGPEKIHFKIRSPDGTWGEETVVDADVPPNLSGPQVVAGEGGVAHLAYTGSDGTAWYRRIQPDGTLTPREQIATGLGTSEYDVGSILPLVFIPETNTVVVIYRLATGKLWERRIVEHGPPSHPVQVSDRNIVQNSVDSDQTGADAIAHGTTVHVLFIEQGSGSIFHTRSNEAGVWQPATLQVDGINAQWIRGTPLTRGEGASVYGYVFDAGSDGGSGMNRFAEVPLGGS